MGISEQPAWEVVFEGLLGQILDGTYPPKSRLPAERELSETLGASRPTIRQALQRLADWGLITTRRGSGAVVNALAAWHFDVLPRYIASRRRPDQIQQLARDLLTLRTALVIDCVRLVGGRIPERAATEIRDAIAFAASQQGVAFNRADLDVIRHILESAAFWPGLWLVNRLGDVYLAIADLISSDVPLDYQQSYEQVLDGLLRGETESAADALRAYFNRQDQRLLATWEAP